MIQKNIFPIDAHIEEAISFAVGVSHESALVAM